jgi:pyridinium-3,5-biscarboxylic acid mononucleotide synthase
MDRENIKNILESVRTGELPVESAMEKLRHFPFEELGIAKIDHHRSLRTGHPEVVYCAGKTTEHLSRIVEAYVARKVNMLLTRIDDAGLEAVRRIEPQVEYNPLARAAWRIYSPLKPSSKKVLVVTAGTSDIPVAEEACVTAESMSCPTEKLYDAGVAGIHRVLEHRELLDKAGAIVVVAGMEGALASVVGGLTSHPVIAVPTSVGYGAAFGGISALLGMLNSCSPGVAVVNIDNGFGAGYFAAVVCRESGLEGDS